MKNFLFSVSAFATMIAVASAETISTTVNTFETNPVTIGDKTFTYISGGGNLNNSGIDFTSTVFPNQTVYDMNMTFSPGLVGTLINFDYSVTVTNPLSHLIGFGIDSQIGSLATNFNLTTTYYSSPGHVGQIAQLVSSNGSNASVAGDFGQLVYVNVNSAVPVDGQIDSFRNGFSQAPNPVPEPSSLALAGFGGVGLIVAAIRRRRKNRVVV